MKRIAPYLWLLLFAVLAYWPMSFMIFSAKNDAIHYFLAMRYNSSEMIQHGIFPSWSPYINLGYPMHGDIQSGVWNPFVLLMSAIRQYDIYWLHTEIILINTLAGVGMFRLLRYLALEKNVCLAIATAYMFNGYMTDAGQFLNWLYAGALLPFVVLYAFKAFRTLQVRNAFGLGLSFALLLLCGYPADTILTSYLLLAWFIFSLWQHRNADNLNTSFRLHFRTAGVALFTVVLICLPALVSFAEFFPEVKRGEGVSLALAQTNSLAPANLISILYPWVTLKGDVFSGTDPLIRNCYMGLIGLAGFILFFLQRGKMDPWQKFLAWVALFFFVFSLGKHAGLRYLTYEFLPLMDTFRHPANAKLFFLFIALIFAGVALHRLLYEQETISSKALRRITLILLSLSAALFVLGLVKSKALSSIGDIFRGDTAVAESIRSFKSQLTSFDLLLFNTAFAVAVLSVLYFLLKKNLLKKFLVALVFFEMAVAAQVMTPLTYVRKFKASEVDRILDAQPNGYPIPDLNANLASNSADGLSTFETIGCYNVYNKKIGRVDYIITPSNLALQEDFWENPGLRNRVMDKPLAYLVDSIYALKDNRSFYSDSSVRSAIWSKSDRPNEARHGSPGMITTLSFQPNRMVFEVHSLSSGMMVLHQNYYHRWRVKRDDSIAPTYLVNGAFMATPVSTGKQVVTWYYYDRDLKIMSVISLVFLISGLVFYFLKRKKETVVEQGHN